MAEKNLGEGGMGQDPGASAEVGKAVGSVRVNSKASIDPTAFKELNTEFKKLDGFVKSFRAELPKLIEDTRKWATALNTVAKNMGRVSDAGGNVGAGGGAGGGYIPPAGSLAAGNNSTNVQTGATGGNTQTANVTVMQGGGGGKPPSGAAAAGQYGMELLSKAAQALDSRIARGAQYSLSADKMNMLYQQTSGLSQNQVYHKYREPLQPYRLGMGGINEVLGLQASTGLNAQAQAKSIDAMRASSGYAYSTSDLTSMTKAMAGPESTNQMFMMMGTGMYGIGGTQRTQQQVFQDVINRSGLTDEKTIQGAFQQGSTVRARLEASGMTEDQINPLLQYAQQNVQFQKKGGKGFYDPSKKSQRELMGVEGNFASQAEETDRVKANREENFYKRQNDNFAQMEKNVQAVNKALQAFEEKLSGIVGARISTKASMVKGAVKWGIAGAVGLAAGIVGTPAAGLAAGSATKMGLDALLGDGHTATPEGGGGGGGGSGGGGGASATTATITTPSGKVPANIKKSQKHLDSLNPRLAARVRRMLEANPKLYIGGGSRTSAQQKALFLSRYAPTEEKTSIKWQGKYWKKKNPNDADAAPPGVSMHEIGLAADIHGDDAWLTANAKDYDLVNFANVNNEPWHIQPKEFTRGQWEYRQAGAPWGLNGGGESFDEGAEINGSTGSELSTVVAKYSHSGGGGSTGGGGGGGGGGYQWADMSMSEVINSGRRGDGMYPSSSSAAVSSKALQNNLSSPLVMSSSMGTIVKGPEYNVTIAPQITLQSSGGTSTDAHKLAKEVSALLEREIKLTLMRTT
jgi:hypothetical protein